VEQGQDEGDLGAEDDARGDIREQMARVEQRIEPRLLGREGNAMERSCDSLELDFLERDKNIGMVQ
jgi:hypothetical protein